MLLHTVIVSCKYKFYMHWKQTKKTTCDSLYCDTCFAAVVWNKAAVSEVCLYITHCLITHVKIPGRILQ